LRTKENATPGVAGVSDPAALQRHVGAVVALLENPVFFFKIKQGAR
jgi:hypothetical protein